MGMLPENNAPVSQDILMVPTPLYYGLGIDWNLLLPLMLVFMRAAGIRPLVHETAKGRRTG